VRPGAAHGTAHAVATTCVQGAPVRQAATPSNNKAYAQARSYAHCRARAPDTQPQSPVRDPAPALAARRQVERVAGERRLSAHEAHHVVDDRRRLLQLQQDVKPVWGGRSQPRTAGIGGGRCQASVCSQLCCGWGAATRTHTRAHARTHTRTHARSRTPTHPHARTPTHPPARTRTHSHLYAR
jgi:hypothetical protein